MTTVLVLEGVKEMKKKAYSGWDVFEYFYGKFCCAVLQVL